MSQWKIEERTAAVLSYDGIQYRRIGVDTMESAEQAYITGHLRILSGLYAMLRLFGGIVPYRLAIKVLFLTHPLRIFYDFWGAEFMSHSAKKGMFS